MLLAWGFATCSSPALGWRIALSGLSVHGQVYNHRTLECKAPEFGQFDLKQNSGLFSPSPPGIAARTRISRNRRSPTSRLSLPGSKSQGSPAELGPWEEVRSLCRDGRLQEALNALQLPKPQDSVASLQIYACLIQECTKRRALVEARRVQAFLASNGLLLSESYLGNLAVDMLVNCGSLSDALEVFWLLPNTTARSWTAVISGFCRAGQERDALRMYKLMQEREVEPNKFTFVCLLKACGCLGDEKQGKRIHADVVRFGCESDVFVATALLGMYAKCGSMADARLVFDTLPERDVVSWNAMISGYAQQNQGEQALQLYAQMQVAGERPNDRTFVSVLKASASLAAKEQSELVDGQHVKVGCLQKGKRVNFEASCEGFDSNVFVGNTLIDMYSRCGSLVDAQQVFDTLSHRTVVTWNALLAGYVQQDQTDKALQLFSEMQRKGVKANCRSFVSVLKACGRKVTTDGAMVVNKHSVSIGCLQQGKAIHCEILQCGLQPDVFLGATLVDMYAKCGSMVDAEHVFDQLPQRDIVTWTAMIAGYTEQEQGEQALRLYADMQRLGVRPNEATFLSILKATSQVGALKICSQIHHDILESDVKLTTSLATTLIHAYGKCGSMVHAQDVFDALLHHDVYCWTALIAGYAQQGEGLKSLQCFTQMLQSGVEPDCVTFLSVLAACSHAGLVEEGLNVFESMNRNHGITKTIEHYVSLVDLLGRAGLFDKVGEILSQMPFKPNMAFWLSLLGACQKHNNVDLGRRAFEGAVQLEPTLGAAYVMMTNIYVRAHMLDDAGKIEHMRRTASPWKVPGLSWVEHDGAIHVFVAGDSNHSEIQDVQSKLVDVSRLLGMKASDFSMGLRL